MPPTLPEARAVLTAQAECQLDQAREHAYPSGQNRPRVLRWTSRKHVGSDTKSLTLHSGRSQLAGKLSEVSVGQACGSGECEVRDSGL